MWRSKPLIPACGKMRQWLSECEARLIYIVSSRLSQKNKIDMLDMERREELSLTT